MIDDGVLRTTLSKALGTEVGALERQPLGGGCINESFVIECEGRWVVKGNDHSIDGQFAAEAAGLAAMRASGTRLVIPRPLCWSDEGPGQRFLVLEYLEPAARQDDFDEELGAGLAELHRHTSERGFGFEMDGTCGATVQPNGWSTSWREFYGQRRLGHQLALARNRGLEARDAQRLEELIGRLGDWLADDALPSLIHGDLWSGNLHVDARGRPALIDPAAYFADREAELGMMSLFGGFGPRVWESYHDAWPLAPGWRQRLGLYELYHLLNHYNLFGGGYARQAMDVVRRYVG